MPEKLPRSVFDIDVPFRRPQWRANRMIELAEHRPRPLRPSRDDSPIEKLLFLYLLARQDAFDDEEKTERLDVKYRRVAVAHQIHNADDTYVRYMIEARVLAREHPEAIAHSLDLTELDVMVYGHLFFDVRDQLDNEVYIRKVAIGLSLHPSSAQIDPDVARGCLLRAVGYYGGPDALEPFVLGFSPGNPPQTPEELEKWLDASVRSTVTTRAWSAAFSSPVAVADRPELIKFVLRSSAKVKIEPALEKDQQWDKRLDLVEQSLAESNSKRAARTGDDNRPPG